MKHKIYDLINSRGLDSYSQNIKRDYRNGITKDLSYNDTLNKCVEDQYIRFIWVNGYSDFMEFKHKDEIDKNIAYKVKKLIKEDKVGYLDGDSFGCYLACRKRDYKDLCKYLDVEYDIRDDDKEFYYNSLFDDILVWFGESCDAINNIQENMNDRQIDKFEKVIYDVARYTIIHIDRYAGIIMSAREYDENCIDDFWINRLWIAAYSDMKCKATS